MVYNAKNIQEHSILMSLQDMQRVILCIHTKDKAIELQLGFDQS